MRFRGQSVDNKPRPVTRQFVCVGEWQESHFSFLFSLSFNSGHKAIWALALCWATVKKREREKVIDWSKSAIRVATQFHCDGGLPVNVHTLIQHLDQETKKFIIQVLDVCEYVPHTLH